MDWETHSNFCIISITSNLIQEPTFLCDPNPLDLVSSFIDALEKLATRSETQMKMNFLWFETTIKSKLARILETLNERRSHCVGTEAEDGNSSTQFLTNAEKSAHWLAGTFSEILKYFTSFWIQQCEVRYQPYQELTTTYSRKRTSCWTDCYQKNQWMRFVQIR